MDAPKITLSIHIKFYICCTLLKIMYVFMLWTLLDEVWHLIKMGPLGMPLFFSSYNEAFCFQG